MAVLSPSPVTAPRPSPATTLAVEARGITKVFGAGESAVRALDVVDLAVARGEMVAIMGPSGSGKSTLLYVIGALDAPTGGSISIGDLHFEGLDDNALTRLRRDHIGFIFQFFNLLPSLTAEENVLLPALISGRPDEHARARARALIEQVGLGDRADHLPSELSGGQQQRVSIARALLREPELLLADEPTGNLDSRSGREVLAVLRDISTREHRTVVMVTHDAVAAATADRVVFLRDGRVAGTVEGGSAQRILEAFAELEPELDQQPRGEPARTG
jgi:putative ABC transport system ATP-binding protein